MYSDFSALSWTSPSAAAFPVYSEYQYISVADPDPVLFVTPGSGIRDGKKIRTRDDHPISFFRELR
jgi:hypothetical protein